MRLITKTPLLPRRAVLAGTGALILSTALTNFAFGLSQSSAVDFIRDVVADVHVIINSGKPEGQMLVDFNTFFSNHAEVSLIAKTVLGAPGRRASKSQLSAYIRAFQGYLSRKYGRQFRNFAGAEINVISSRDAGTKGVFVKSLVDRPVKYDYDMDWWVIEVNGRPKMFDLIIEGVSLISSERTEVGALLESVGGDITKLTAKLNAS